MSASFVRNPFKNLKLDKYEKELSDSIEKGEWKTVKNMESEKKKLKEIVSYTLDKTKNINIRLSARDLSRLKVKAMEDGLPYQTLAASILHKYVSQ